jgi:hypothetical protein
MKSNLPHTHYLLGTSCIAVLLLGLVFTLNLLVDPLWHFDGSRLGAMNYPFNERVAKLNRLLKHRDDYDCIILGSSRVTLLDERRVELGRCFNLSFSGGIVTEFIAIAKYLKKQGIKPQTLIVGIDGFNFSRAALTPELPGFVAAQRAPDSFIHDYLSLSAFGFSLRAVFGNDDTLPTWRYYDADFIGKIKKSAPIYVVEEKKEKYSDPSVVFQSARSEHYRELRALFPESYFIAYVPPVSLWKIRGMANAGVLPDYLLAIYKSSQFFDQAWDFSAPSAITADSSRTYDGSHYDLETNDEIAYVLSSQLRGEMLDLKALRFDDYFEIFNEKFEWFLSMQ